MNVTLENCRNSNILFDGKKESCLTSLHKVGSVCNLHEKYKTRYGVLYMKFYFRLSNSIGDL